MARFKALPALAPTQPWRAARHQPGLASGLAEVPPTHRARPFLSAQKRRARGQATCRLLQPADLAKSTALGRRSRKPAANGAAAITPSTPAPEKPRTDTPLRIPYGNKGDALKLGARYQAGQWCAPPGVDLSAFGERGWL